MLKADLHPAPPYPLNSGSSGDALLIMLALQDGALDQEPYSWYNKLTSGDGNLTFLQVDIGSENTNLGAVRVVVERIWCATPGRIGNLNGPMKK